MVSGRALKVIFLSRGLLYGYLQLILSASCNIANITNITIIMILSYVHLVRHTLKCKILHLTSLQNIGNTKIVYIIEYKQHCLPNNTSIGTWRTYTMLCCLIITYNNGLCQ